MKNKHRIFPQNKFRIFFSSVKLFFLSYIPILLYTHTLKRLFLKFDRLKLFAVYFLVTNFILTSCQFIKKKPDPKEGAVARAYDKFLYLEDLKKIIPRGTVGEDSIMLSQNYINSWIKQQAILHRAETNLSNEQKNVDKQMEEYRNSLITYIYETELIRQRLDTTVTDEEIEKYYKDNPSNFQLKDNIVKVIYLKVKQKTPKLNKVRDWYKGATNKDLTELEEYCHAYASDYYLDDTQWIPFRELLKKVPIKTYDQEQYLRNNRFIEINDSNDVYFINIKGFMIKESLSPLSFEKDNIRNLIINKRKLQLVSEMETTTFDNALKKNEIEIYK